MSTPAAGDRPSPRAELLRMHSRKTFPGVVALVGVDFDLRVGEAHVLLGENGAGKSALIEMLSGAYRPGGGRTVVDGPEVRSACPGCRAAGHRHHLPGVRPLARPGRRHGSGPPPSAAAPRSARRRGYCCSMLRPTQPRFVLGRAGWWPSTDRQNVDTAGVLASGIIAGGKLTAQTIAQEPGGKGTISFCRGRPSPRPRTSASRASRKA